MGKESLIFSRIRTLIFVGQAIILGGSNLLILSVDLLLKFKKGRREIPLKSVFFLSHNFWERGAVSRLYNMGRRLVQKGYRVTLIASSLKGRIMKKENNLEVLSFPSLFYRWNPYGGWDLWETLLRTLYLLKNPPSLVHISSHKPGVVLPAVISRILHGSKVIFLPQGKKILGFAGFFQEEFYRKLGQV